MCYIDRDKAPNTQSRQSARLFLQSSELGPPIPSPAGECVPLRWDRHCGTLGIYVYFVPHHHSNRGQVGNFFPYEQLIF
jgi:hypothetical protein